MIAVDGRIQIDRYEKDGQQRRAYKIVANDIRFLGGGGQEDRAPFDLPTPPDPPLPKVPPIEDPGDLPF